MACNLVRDGEITSVFVMLGREPNDIEMAAARKKAATCGLEFRFDDPSALTVWVDQPEPAEEDDSLKLNIPIHRPHLPAWNLGFPGLGEGTR